RSHRRRAPARLGPDPVHAARQSRRRDRRPRRRRPGRLDGPRLRLLRLYASAPPARTAMMSTAPRAVSATTPRAGVASQRVMRGLVAVGVVSVGWWLI